MIIHSFDDQTQPPMSMADFYGEQKHLIDICIITFSETVYKNILQMHNCRQIGTIRAANGLFPIHCFVHEGMTIGFYLSAIGSALAANHAIEANWLTGATKFILFGSAGSLDPVTMGKYVLPIESYRDEGMSYHYAPPSDYITVKNSGKLQAIFEELNLPHVTGRIWTTDAFLRETAGNIAKRRADGCIAVEMEIAGVQAVCDFHGLELYPFVVTGDVLETDCYDVTGLDSANHDMDKFYIALEIAKRI